MDGVGDCTDPFVRIFNEQIRKGVYKNAVE